jgi:proteasome accessory factor A
VATLLRVGTMQIVLAMIEAGDVDCTLALDDPLSAVRTWSHDPTLQSPALLVTGQAVTAVQLQRRFLERAKRFLDRGLADSLVPRAGEIVALWEDTLEKLERADWASLAGRLDWVMKQTLLSRVLSRNSELGWDSPEIKHLDQLFSSLDPSEGLYWSVAASGCVEQVVSEEEIARFMAEPPSDTRAWGRAMLLRHAGTAVDRVDWDFVRITRRNTFGVRECWRVDFPDPLDADAARVSRATQSASSLEELLVALGATVERPVSTLESYYSGVHYSWPAIDATALHRGMGRGDGWPKLGEPTWDRKKGKRHNRGGGNGSA